MNSYESFSNSSKGSTRWLLWSLIFIFLTTLTTFTVLEVRSLSDEEPSVIRIILNSIKRPNDEKGQEVNLQPNKFVLVNLENVQQNEEELVKAIVTQVEDRPNSGELERKARDVVGSAKNNTYYEEQTPVVVYSKTDQEAPLAYRQEAPVPYAQGGSHEEQPYYNGEYNRDYAADDGDYYRPQYDDDSREDFPGPQEYANEADSAEGRSTQNRQYDAYYRQWHYATPSPASSSVSSGQSSQGNRKFQTMTKTATGGSQDPYATYLDDYDYMDSHHRSPAMSSKYQQQQVQPYRPQTSSQAVQKPQEQGHEMTLMSVLKTLKTMWDLYQSFISAWNSMAEQHNKREELAKQKYKQRQEELRINSKKPPKIESKKRPQSSTKNPKTNSKQTTKTTTSSTTESSIASAAEDEEEESVKPQQLRKAKVEPRKGSKGDETPSDDVESLRKRRQAEDQTKETQSTDVGEGRYIKGDPLKGYYDFVITEGSYKFWAAFQVGTALLIIYSTFAAIYYSKVNPLVSDYDYTDYLGGARSLSGGDLDFVDDETAEGSSSNNQNGAQYSKGWFDWVPRTGHSLKFILDAIDKLPIDHDASETKRSAGEEEDNAADVKEDLKESGSNRAM